ISRTTIALAAFILLPFYLSYYFYVVLPNDIANENTEKIEKANKIYKSNNSELINIYKPGRYGTHLPSHEQCYGDQHIYLGFSNGSIDEGIDLPCSTTRELCSGTKNMYKEDVNYDDSEKLEDVKSSCKSNGW
ncbi:hypothetical protein, partial [Tolypothrix sp. NIES-4075]|uniref:hypothetical protein n=1 Tax=Tolypothrix sp. NIES-4075 TaxID=2005459 RepID=UPI001356EED7